MTTSLLTTRKTVIRVMMLLAFALISPLPQIAAAAAAKPHVVFLISEDPDNYEAHRTIPVFAEELRAKQNLDVTVIKGEGKLVEFRFPRLTEVLPRADLVVVFARRLALPPEQMNALKAH